MRRILLDVSLFTLVCLFSIFLLRERRIVDVLASPQNVITSKRSPMKQRPSGTQVSKIDTPRQGALDTPRQGALDTFYQTIIDNNIFRPLNWQPPHRDPVYTLLGTTVPTYGGTAEAYIQDRQSEQLHIVNIGDPLGDSTVQQITPKQVVLTTKKGRTTHLSLSRNIFINPRHTHARRSYELIPQTQSHTQNKTTAEKQNNTENEIDTQRWHEAGIQLLKKRANELRTERTRMQERLRYLEQR